MGGERASINNRSDLTTPDKARYDKAYTTQHAVRLEANAFSAKVTRGQPVSSHTDKAAFDAWWGVNRVGTKLRENPAVGVQLIANIGFMSQAAVDDIWSDISTGSFEEADAMLQTLQQIESRNSAILPNSLTKEQHSKYAFWKYGQHRSVPIEETITQVRNFGKEAVAGVRDARVRDYNKELTDDPDVFTREEVVDVLDLEDVSSRSVGIGMAVNDYVSLHRTFFVDGGMSWREARRAAKDLVLRSWGKNINGNAMYLPPSVTGTPKLVDPDTGEFNYFYVEQLVRDDASALGVPEEANIMLFADGQTVEEHATGAPVSYQLIYVDDEGVVRPATREVADGLDGVREEVARIEVRPTQKLIDQNENNFNLSQYPGKSFMLGVP